MKVNISKIDVEIKDRLDKFKADHNLRNPNNRLGTIEDTIGYLVQIGEFMETVVFGDETIGFTEENIDALEIDNEKKETLKKFVK